MLSADLAEDLERHRAELTGYCYRMLGSGFEAEDAVQEAFVRAWRTYDAGRGPLRSWLFHLATNVCLDMLRGPQRRARAMDLGPAATPGAALGEPLPEGRWVQPVPDARVLGPADPADVAVTRETVRLAFVAALQHLPPRQRAVLILRDVLKWSAAETAGLLATTVASVNSALQRARSRLPAVAPLDAEVDEELLRRYVTAFERYDVDTLVSLLHEDATTSMPPFTWWLRGREAVRAILLASGAPCEGSRLVPTRANGCPAFGQYDRDGKPFALVVLEVSGGLIAGETTYLDPGLFPLFELPMSFGAAHRTGG
ncbi:sigma-70 family RNA polymerase sigma factor [Nonomuraea sp. PA05]|uniref:sigma-70 family RNA polymerase sigma factor n=1 Tax=Nonomuraea sp. PA05 TaxID=2604466 RepID=UPI0011DA9E4E|nr:sigma-70 family RNA polymerase sigma factor [Nonomuraea sp. PA05]TYB59843.1 sigma-70 family RNA polymerase sigma factor [Nonomuraea sp. PA05]